MKHVLGYTAAALALVFATAAMASFAAPAFLAQYDQPQVDSFVRALLLAFPY